MSDLRKAAQQALEALEDACGNRCNAENNPCYQRIVAEVLRAALAQPEQEPVAWLRHRDSCLALNDAGLFGDGWSPLYTAPPQRKPMRDAEIVYLWEWAATAEAERTASTQQHAFARAIEKAHGIGGDV
jgi:hypothetical protein